MKWEMPRQEMAIGMVITTMLNYSCHYSSHTNNNTELGKKPYDYSIDCLCITV